MISDCKLAGIALAALVAVGPQVGHAASCAPVMPALDVFGLHIANRGQTRNAFQLAAKERAIAARSCACPYEGWSFADFIAARFDKSPEALTEPDIRALRAWSDAHGVGILRAYRGFYAANCTEDR